MLSIYIKPSPSHTHTCVDFWIPTWYIYRCDSPRYFDFDDLSARTYNEFKNIKIGRNGVGARGGESALAKVARTDEGFSVLHDEMKSLNFQWNTRAHDLLFHPVPTTHLATRETVDPMTQWPIRYIIINSG